MEANEVQELKEHAEHSAHEETMRPVAFTMAVLAVLVAIATVLGHRTHTEAVLNQNRATDAWNFYQAHKIRANDTELAADLLGVHYFSVYRLIQRGQLKACRALRGKFLVPRTELLKLLKT